MRRSLERPGSATTSAAGEGGVGRAGARCGQLGAGKWEVLRDRASAPARITDCHGVDPAIDRIQTIVWILILERLS